MARLLIVLYGLLVRSMLSAAQPSLSQSMPLPPLQWINLSNHTNGSPPPPLRDSAIGYDESSRTLLIFGGQSQPNTVTQQTFLLNLDTLQWSQAKPSLPDAVYGQIPPPRSKPIGGADEVANARRSFVMFGGMGNEGVALNDAWSYDYADQFWVQLNATSNGPSGRWGSVGGTDLLQSIVDPNPSTFLNTLYVFGGYNTQGADPLSDTWELTLDGQLSVNNPHSIIGTWNKLNWPTSLPGTNFGQSSTVLHNKAIVSYGGCGSPIDQQYNSSCAQRDSVIMNTNSLSGLNGSLCPTPRFAPSVAPNYNPSSPSFASQVFVLFGSFDSNQWNDDQGLQHGEVAVLDTSSNLWSRVIPAGDPGFGLTTPELPPRREGAASLSYPSALVGDNRPSSSDTIVFGGQDTQTGLLLNDIWLLRAYNGVVNGTNQTWTGFGNGQLTSNISADGQGVKIVYLSDCAIPITQAASSSSTISSTLAHPTSPISPSPSTTGVSSTVIVDASTTHKVLSPVAIAIMLASFLILRLIPPLQQTESIVARLRVLYAASSLALVSLACGLAGMSFGFSTAVSRVATARRSSEVARVALESTHGKVGLALTCLLYGFVLLTLGQLALYLHHRTKPPANTLITTYGMKDIASTNASPRPSTIMQRFADHISRPSSPPSPSSFTGTRERAKSADVDTVRPVPWPRLQEGPNNLRSPSSELLPTSVSSQSRGFEVINRPKDLRRQRRATLEIPAASQHPPLPRSLSDINWLKRRRSVNAASELDYMLSQNNRAHSAATNLSFPAHSAQGSVGPLVQRQDEASVSTKDFGSLTRTCFRLLLHVVLLCNVIFGLVALWKVESIAPFVIFLAWYLLVYVIMGILAWHGVPCTSILTKVISMTRPLPPASYAEKENSSPEAPTTTELAYRIGQGPYLHTPPVRRASSPYQYPPQSSQSPPPRLVESDLEDDDDEDDEEKQRRMEQEMQRRDVSIITVPRRQLRVANL